MKVDLDTCLAQWHIKFQQRYKNEHDEGLTYVGPLGALPLTPAMVFDWVCALEEGQATLLVPSNIQSFNPANKVLFLHHARQVSYPSFYLVNSGPPGCLCTFAFPDLILVSSVLSPLVLYIYSSNSVLHLFLLLYRILRPSVSIVWYLCTSRALLCFRTLQYILVVCI